MVPLMTVALPVSVFVWVWRGKTANANKKDEMKMTKKYRRKECPHNMLSSLLPSSKPMSLDLLPVPIA